MSKANPCIRNCCLSDDDICMGCFRHLDEILSWNKMNDEQKQTTLVRCKQRKEQYLHYVKANFNRR